jgi:hypothetical protein
MKIFTMFDEKRVFSHEIATVHVVIKCQTGFENRLLKILEI